MQQAQRYYHIKFELSHLVINIHKTFTFVIQLLNNLIYSLRESFLVNTLGALPCWNKRAYIPNISQAYLTKILPDHYSLSSF